MSVYVLPRGKRKLGKSQALAAWRLKLGSSEARKGGPALLIAAVMATAIDDYLAGDEAAADDARWYLAGEGDLWRQHCEALGVDPARVPAELAPYVVDIVEAT